MGFDDAMRDGETEADAVRHLVDTAVAPEGFENAVLIGSRDADPVIRRGYGGSSRASSAGGLFVLEEQLDRDKLGVTDASAKNELAKLFGDGFEVIRNDVVDGVADWGMDYASLVCFVARKK